MDNNKIKLNYNEITGIAAFQFLSDNGHWVDVPMGSPLSRERNYKAISEDRVEELLEVINRYYNVDGCGVEIIYTGAPETFLKIHSHMDSFTQLRLIRRESKNVIIGKRGVGKTYLAKGIMNYLGRIPIVEETEGFLKYIDDEDGICLYEIKGIDIGIINVEKSYKALRKCIGDGVKTIFYCFHGKTGKIEETEIDFIMRVERENPTIKITPVVTVCIDEKESDEFAQKIKQELGPREVILVLSEEMKTKIGSIPSFGLDKIVKKLDGGD